MRIASAFSVVTAAVAFCGVLSGQRPQGDNERTRALVNKVVDAVGGAAAVAQVKGTRLTLTRHLKTAYGDEVVTVDQITDYPDRIWMLTKTPLFEGRTVLTPADSFTVTAGTVRDLPPTTRQEAARTIRLGFISVAKHAQDPEYMFAITGEEIVGGLRTAVLEIAVGGEKATWNVDPSTGRIIRTSRVTAGSGGTPARTIVEYSDWRVVNGLSVPFRAAQSGSTTSVDELLSFQINPNFPPTLFQRPSAATAGAAATPPKLGGPLPAGGPGDTNQADSRKVAEQRFRQDCVKDVTASGIVSLSIATHSCECGVKALEKTASLEEAAKAAGACAEADSRTAATSKPGNSSTALSSRPSTLLAELRGSLARRREYDLWLIRNVSQIINGAMSAESRQGKILSYCMTTVYGAEQTVDSAPETEYVLQADGTVLITSGKPPMTPEQRFREGQRMQFELETGGGPVVQDCAGSLFWFGTWHDQPMPSDEKFMDIAAKARADVDEIDKMLDPRLVESLPKPAVMRRDSPSSPPPPPSIPPSQISPVALNNRGVARQDKGDLDGAIQDYSEAIRLKPDYAIAFLSRGTARRVKGDLDGAIQDDTEAIRLKPDDAISFGERGIARRAKGDLDGAMQDFSEAIRLKPNDAKVFVYRGEARLAKGDLDGAIQDFSAAIALKPDYAESFSDRGVARQNKGDVDGAIQDYSQAIRLKPDYAVAFDNRGTARQLKGDLDGAIQDFTEAIRLKPDYARAFHDRGATRARKGDAGGAQQDNSRAAQLGWH